MLPLFPVAFFPYSHIISDQGYRKIIVKSNLLKNIQACNSCKIIGFGAHFLNPNKIEKKGGVHAKSKS